jgi:glutaredoxin 3
MMRKITFYHAGCPVCVSAEQGILDLLDPSRITMEIVHFANQPERLEDAEKAGVKSVPAMVLDNGEVLHINFGASLEDVKKLVL